MQQNGVDAKESQLWAAAVSATPGLVTALKNSGFTLADLWKLFSSGSDTGATPGPSTGYESVQITPGISYPSATGASLGGISF